MHVSKRTGAPMPEHRTMPRSSVSNFRRYRYHVPEPWSGSISGMPKHQGDLQIHERFLTVDVNNDILQRSCKMQDATQGEFLQHGCHDHDVNTLQVAVAVDPARPPPAAARGHSRAGQGSGPLRLRPCTCGEIHAAATRPGPGGGGVIAAP
jgi:hypothetical protein